MRQHSSNRSSNDRGQHNHEARGDQGRGHHDRKGPSDKRNKDDDKHDGRGHGNGDHNGDGHPDNGCGGVVTPPPPPPPPPAPVLSLTTQNVTGASTSQALTGNAGDDQMSGGWGNDTLIGGAGNDVINGDGPGSVTVGLDIAASLSNAANSAAISVVVSGLPAGASLSAGTANPDGSWTVAANQLSGLSITASDAADFTLNVVATSTDGSGLSAPSSIAVSLARGNDDLIDGGDGNDILDGGTGNDRILDGSGSDNVYGGTGNDTFVAGSGNDFYSGGEGFDTIDFSAAPGGENGGVYVALADGLTSDMGSGTGEDLLNSIEGVVGSAGSDHLAGNLLANRIDGGAGNDVIAGHAGGDTLTGGAGDDIFVFDVVYTMSIAPAADTITDFHLGDFILLNGFSGVTLQDNGQDTTISAVVYGNSIAIIDLENFSGYTLNEMSSLGMIA